MRHSFRRLAMLVVSCTAAASVPFVSACDGDGVVGLREPPTAVATAAHVVAGDAIPVRLTNRSALAWSYSMCGQTLQRLDGDQWTTLPPPLVLCAPELSNIAPGDVIDEEMYVPAGTAPGTHRAVLRFVSGGEEVERVTNSFDVIVLADAAATSSPPGDR